MIWNSEPRAQKRKLSQFPGRSGLQSQRKCRPWESGSVSFRSDTTFSLPFPDSYSMIHAAFVNHSPFDSRIFQGASFTSSGWFLLSKKLSFANKLCLPSILSSRFSPRSPNHPSPIKSRSPPRYLERVARIYLANRPRRMAQAGMDRSAVFHIWTQWRGPT